MQQITNIAGYKFIPLTDLPALRAALLATCTALGLKGTILLSAEGINITLAGDTDAIAAIQSALQADARFADMSFRESFSSFQPFRFMKVKLRKEIITLRQPAVRPEAVPRASHISPSEFKQWLDENRDITILDTRNDYEVRFGTFKNAQHFGLKDFCEFPTVAEKLPREKPIVMFCTGGIRCEKAALQLENDGFPEVYQLDGGILNYFSEVGAAHYDGDCFVFDQRVALNPALEVSGSVQCEDCQGPVPEAAACMTCAA